MKRVIMRLTLIMLAMFYKPLDAFIAFGYQAGAKEVDIEKDGELVKSVKFTFPTEVVK